MDIFENLDKEQEQAKMYRWIRSNWIRSKMAHGRLSVLSDAANLQDMSMIEVDIVLRSAFDQSERDILKIPVRSPSNKSIRLAIGKMLDEYTVLVFSEGLAGVTYMDMKDNCTDKLVSVYEEINKL